MTKAELLKWLAEWPDDTPIFHQRGEDLREHHLSSMNYDDWAKSTITKDADGVEYETPAVGVGIHIGRKF